MKVILVVLAGALLVLTIASASGTSTAAVATASGTSTPAVATALDPDCPCLQSTQSQYACSCSVTVSTNAGSPTNGECQLDDSNCTLDEVTCLWSGVVIVDCGGGIISWKPFFLQACCGAGSTRVFRCTGGTGHIELVLDCANCV